jgi:undecaprenyl-diphosphatase
MFSVFKNINQFANKSKLLDGFAIFCAVYLLYLLIIFLFLFAFLSNNWPIFIYPFSSGLFSAFVISKIIYIFFRERRPAEFKNTNILIGVPKNPSFPSRHSSLLFGMSFFLLFYNLPVAIFFIICSCFVGISRVFCGVHWFRDILAGAFVGLISALFIHLLLNYY